METSIKAEGEEAKAMQMMFNSEAYGLHWGMIPLEAGNERRQPVHEPEVRDAIRAYEKRKFEAGYYGGR